MNKPAVGLYVRTSRGLAVLSALLREAGTASVGYVETAADERMRQDACDEICAAARAAGVPVWRRKDAPARRPAVAARFAAGWSWLLEQSAAEPLVVFHDSRLPRYRGFAPLVSCLLNGEPELGVTALLAGPEFDRGPILHQETVPVTYPLRIADAFRLVEPIYARLAVAAYRDLTAGSFSPRTQDEAKASYSLWRDEADYVLDWSLDASRLRRWVDAVGEPYRGALVYADGKAFRVRAASELADVRIENRTPGKIMFMDAGRPVVVCGTGLLRLDDIVADDTAVNALPWPRLRTRFGGP